MRIDMYKRIDYRCIRCNTKTHDLINTLRSDMKLCNGCYHGSRGFYIANAFLPLKDDKGVKVE
jgi:hypothetical protein